MEELSQKEQISVIFIPPDTAPTSVGAKAGFAEGWWSSGAWEMLLLFLESCTDWKHWKSSVFSCLCSGFAVHKHFRDRGWCSPRGAAAHAHLGLVRLNNLKGLFHPKICDCKTFNHCSKPGFVTAFILSLHLRDSSGIQTLWLERQRFKTSERNLPGCRISLHISLSLRAQCEEGLFSSQSQRKKTPLSGQ